MAEKTMESALQQWRRQEPTSTQPSITKVSLTDLQKKYPKARDLSKVKEVYSPSHWRYVGRFPEKAYLENCPTLGEIDIMFGMGESGKWMLSQFLVLFAESVNANMMIVNTLEMLAGSFANDVRQYKLTELMLFFDRYSHGRYGDKYGTYDPRKVCLAFFNEFVPERAAELQRIERQKNNDIRRLEYERMAAHGMTHEKAVMTDEYKRMIDQLKARDNEG